VSIADVQSLEHHCGMLTLILLLSFASEPAQNHWPPTPPETARASLGFSGATLSIRSVDDPKRPGTARRRLTLTLPSGASRTLNLHDGGGLAENHALDLHHVGQDGFLLVSQKDCVEIDPIRVALNRCVKSVGCAKSRSYVGRFDWMNAFDPPKGAFHFGFRFLPAHDAIESGGCRQPPRSKGETNLPL
jgi:hypothetical protein